MALQLGPSQPLTHAAGELPQGDRKQAANPQGEQRDQTFPSSAIQQNTLEYTKQNSQRLVLEIAHPKSVSTSTPPSAELPAPHSTEVAMVQISEVKGTKRDNRTAAHTHIKGLGLKLDGSAENQAAGFVGQEGAREVGSILSIHGTGGRHNSALLTGPSTYNRLVA